MQRRDISACRQYFLSNLPNRSSCTRPVCNLSLHLYNSARACKRQTYIRQTTLLNNVQTKTSSANQPKPKHCCKQQTLRARISSLIRALCFYRFSQRVSPVVCYGYLCAKGINNRNLCDDVMSNHLYKEVITICTC